MATRVAMRRNGRTDVATVANEIVSAQAARFPNLVAALDAHEDGRRGGVAWATVVRRIGGTS